MPDDVKKYGSNKPSQKLNEGAIKKGGTSGPPSTPKPTVVPVAQNPNPATPPASSTGQNPLKK